MADDVLKSFLISLDWKVHEESQRRFVESIEKAQKGVLSIAAAFGALEIAQKFEKTARALEGIYFSATRAGTSVGKLEDLQYAFTQVGGSAQEATGLVESFSRKLRENPEGIGAFFKSLTGKSAFTDATHTKLRDTIELIGELDKALAGKTPQQRLHIEESGFGLDEKSMREFRETAKFVAEHAEKRKLFGLDDKSAKDAHDFENELRDIKDTLELMWESEASKLFRNFGEDLKAFDEYLKAHREGIATALEVIVAAMVPLGAVLTLRVVPGLTGMLSALGALTRFALPGWLASLLGVSATSLGLGAGAYFGSTQPLGEGEDEAYRQGHPGWVPGQPKEGEADTRNFWQRHAPKFLGGQDAPAGADYTGTGGNPTFGEMNAHYRTYAQAHGVSPDLITGLSLQEGGLKDPGGHFKSWGHSDPSRSGAPGIAYGPFQLRKPGLGDVFERQTGLKLDSSTWRQQGEFAVDYIAKHGTGPWMAVGDNGGIGGLTSIGRNWQNRNAGRAVNIPAAHASPWKDFVPPNFTLPPGHSASDPFGFHADVVRRAQSQGSWSSTTNNNNSGSHNNVKTTINIDGAGMDPHAMADMIGRKQVRVHADFLRNSKSAIS